MDQETTNTRPSAHGLLRDSEYWPENETLSQIRGLNVKPEPGLLTRPCVLTSPDLTSNVKFDFLA